MGLGFCIRDLGGAHDYRARAVPEKNRDFTSVIIFFNSFRVDFRTHDQNLFIGSASDELICNRKRIDEAGALLADIECRDSRKTQFFLKKTGRAREFMIGGNRGDDQHFDFTLIDPRIFQRDRCSLESKIRGSDVSFDPMSLFNSGALTNPFV